jgi:hypothetical protein
LDGGSGDRQGLNMKGEKKYEDSWAFEPSILAHWYSTVSVRVLQMQFLLNFSPIRLSNVLTPGFPVANPKSGPDYCVYH